MNSWHKPKQAFIVIAAVSVILAACNSQTGTKSEQNGPEAGAASVQPNTAKPSPTQAKEGQSTSAQNELGTMNTIMVNGRVLSEIRQKVKDGNDGDYRSALTKLKSDAGAALKVGPFSVVNKTGVPPSGDKHDYMSMAPYWWPDPNKPDGRPYIQKDGQTNPERSTSKYDVVNYNNMAGTVQTLSLAYYLTAEQSYADHAAKLLRTWFLDPATKMNPNMNYGQSVPGREDGRKEGVLDSRMFLLTTDAVILLQGSGSWSDPDTEAYRTWIGQYVKWLKENKLAIAEKNASNNHSTWYDAIFLGLSLFTGDKDGVTKYIKEQFPKRIVGQIEKDGSQPKEMSRTRSFHYPVFNLQAFSIVAIIGQKVGEDVWSYKTADGRSIHQAYNYLVPYFNGKQWTGEQIHAENEAEFASYLREAAVIYGDKTYAEAADHTLGKDKDSSRINLIAPMPK